MQTISHTTEFGWLFPPAEARRQSLIDTVWLRDFSRDIEALQVEIRKQTASVYKDEDTICHEDAAGRDSHSEDKWQGECVHNKETSSHEDAATRESHSEIERLQSELRRHPAFVCRGERTRYKGEILRTECHSIECCAAMKGNESECGNPEGVKCEVRLCAPVRGTSCGELADSSSAGSSVQTRALDFSGVAISNRMASDGESNYVSSNRGIRVKEERESHCHNVGESSESEMSCDLDSGLSTFRDDTAKCDVYNKLQRKEKTQRSVSDEESCVGEESFLFDSSPNTYTSGSAKCDAYSSMHSDVSRDSGIFTADDTSFLSEGPGDMSLLQELGDVLSDQDVSLESCVHCGSLPLEEVEPGIKGNAGYTVWLKRFSSSNNDLSLSFESSHEWEVREEGEHSPKTYSFGSESPVVVRRKKWGSEKEDSKATTSDEEQVVKGQPCSACEKLNEGVKVAQRRVAQRLIEGSSVKQWGVCKGINEGAEMKQRSANENRNEIKDVQAELCVTCKKLQQESPISRLQTQRTSAMVKFSKSFQGINKRVEDLRSGLDDLYGEVNKSKHEFMSLERRAKQLLASTVTSRQRLAHVRVLALLEDRLQEEWWAAYDPGSVPFHENYIV